LQGEFETGRGKRAESAGEKTLQKKDCFVMGSDGGVGEENKRLGERGLRPSVVRG